MKSLCDAQNAVLNTMERLPSQRTSLREARGLVLARDVFAPHDVPHFANSAMDGFAVRASDVTKVPARLIVLEDVPAGSVPTQSVVAGSAIKIMTGAPLPDGADTVVKVEDTEGGDGSVTIIEPAPFGTAVRKAGGDIAEGELVLRAGTRLTSPHLGVLASIGMALPEVRRRPSVALVSTGDEVLPADAKQLASGKIRDTNRPILQAALEDLGASVIDYGIVGDDPVQLNETLDHAARAADVVVSSGGVSMGEYDLVREQLSALGTVDFWKVAMQPAKPFAFGKLGDTPLFGLPGNPVSVFVAFEQFVRPALLEMMGAQYLFRPRVPAVTRCELATDPAKAVFVRVVLDRVGAGLEARPSGGQSSNVLTALALADAFAVVPVGAGTVEVGGEVEVELFRNMESRTRGEALRD